MQDFYRKHIKDMEKNEDDLEITDIIIGKYDNKPLNELLKYSIEQLPYLNKEQLREARDERDKFSAVSSKTYLIIPTMIFLGNGPYMWMYVEVHMNSKKKYSQSQFDIIENLIQYIQHQGVNYVKSKDEIIDEVSKIVRNAILSGDSRIVIEHIYVVIR